MLNEIKQFMESYYNMELITNKFNNTGYFYKVYFNTDINNYIITIVKSSHVEYAKKYMTSVYVNKNNNNIKCVLTIKTPYNRDVYNFIMPKLIRKIKSIEIADIVISKSDETIYDSNNDAILMDVNILLHNNDCEETIEKISKVLSIVNLYNESVYDRLKTKYETKYETNI